MEDNKKVYVVFSYGGEYDCKWEKIVKVFDSKKKAQDYYQFYSKLSEKYSNIIPEYNDVIDIIKQRQSKAFIKSNLEDNNDWDDINIPEIKTPDELIELKNKFNVSTDISDEDLKYLFSELGEYDSDFDNMNFPFYYIEEHTLE